LDWNRQQIELRKTQPALRDFNKKNVRVHVLGCSGMVLHRSSPHGDSHVMALINFTHEPIHFHHANDGMTFSKILNSNDFRLEDEKKKSQSELPEQLSIPSGKDPTSDCQHLHALNLRDVVR
jgi:maltooligosyltrehalose trehalohydrolase